VRDLAAYLAAFVADPVVTRALGAALSVVLFAGAWQKLRDRELFQAALDNYRLLPDALLRPAAILLPAWEIAAGALLLSAQSRVAGAGLAAALLLVVTGAVAINLWRGRRDFDCGCGGLSSHVGEQTLSWGLVGRNVLLLAALALSLGEDNARLLVSIDYLSVAGATLALLGLYVSSNQLMANHPRLQALRNY